jgi:hypothetical protein
MFEVFQHFYFTYFADIPVQMTVDKGSETGEMYAQQVALQ